MKVAALCKGGLSNWPGKCFYKIDELLKCVCVNLQMVCTKGEICNMIYVRNQIMAPHH